MADALIAAACEARGPEAFRARNAFDVEKYEGPMEVVSLD
ncbi:hypothetical protein GGP51_003075 [Salinibacter ruber]|nr:hypothetical protein [Salinibacter ruber]